MSPIDYVIFGSYFGAVLGVGVYFYRKNQTREDYYVGNRNISSGHVGMSIVATDVGGGFSLGLGGLGFVMGLSGSWLLFTGLVGAWLAAILVVPRVKQLDQVHGFLTFPDFLKHTYGPRVAMAAAVISGLGYLGFTAGQIQAGATLAAGSVFADVTFMDPVKFSLMVMAAVVIIYTAMGGLKAVIYTDTIQWAVLLAGLLFCGLPFAWIKVGGWQALRDNLPAAHFSLTNIAPVEFINWIATIVPVWFVGMTLYQRIYACKDVKQARKAFYIAGLLEYPLMAFLGVSLGLMARVVFPEAQQEMAMPMLLSHALPVGITGIVLAAYFSAIMSTADSCLIASSGHFVNDLIEPGLKSKDNMKLSMRLSQIATLVLGTVALGLTQAFDTVLEIIMHAYSVMVAGLLVPTLAALFARQPHPKAALGAMVGGCGVTAGLIVVETAKWATLPLGLAPSIFGLMTSVLIYGLAATMTRNSHA